MSQFDGKQVASLSAVAFGVAMVGVAGVAHLSRQSQQDLIVAEQKRLEQLETNFENARSGGDAAPVQAGAVWRLLHGPDVVATLQQLQAMGDELGVVFETQKAVPSADPDKQPFLLRGRGTAQQVARFVAAVERSPRLMILETGRMTPAGGDQIAFEFGLATYHGEEAR